MNLCDWSSDVCSSDLSWEHYVAAPAPPDVIIDGVVCDTRADMVIRTFWVISPLHISKSSTS